MKPAIVRFFCSLNLCQIILLLVGSLPARSQVPSKAQLEFEEHIAKGGRSYGFEETLNPEWQNWSGANTDEGFSVLVEEITHSRVASRRELAFLYLDSPILSKPALAAFLLAGAKAHRDAPAELISYLNIMERGNVMEEPDIVAYIASHNADIRSVETKPRHPESMAGQTVRVCDYSSGVLASWMLKKGHLKYGDPGLGDTGGETMWVGRNKQIDAVNGVLLKMGLIQTAVRPDDNAVTPPPPRPAVRSVAEPVPPTPVPEPAVDPFKNSVSKNEPPDPFADHPQAASVLAPARAGRLSWWAASVLIAGGIAFLCWFFKKHQRN